MNLSTIVKGSTIVKSFVGFILLIEAIWSVATNAVVLMWILMTLLLSVFVSWRAPFPRRLGAAFLAVVALTYLFAGSCGLGTDEAGPLLEPTLWGITFSPYLQMSVYRDAEEHARLCERLCGRDINWTGPYDFVPIGLHHGSSALIMAISGVAFISAFVLVKPRKSGFYVWSVLIIASLGAFLFYAVMAVRFWGIVGIAPQIVLESFTLVGFALASGLVDLGRPALPQD